ncbi:MAG: biosynthetic arginine decarboxylase [Gammaproteobacteria bacterium]|nr:biosynthetic arginine decarboxylase [Gammaproteobacteria bacterium]
MTGSTETKAAARPWRVADAAALYHLDAWGAGYFDVNARGHVVVRPDQRADREIDLLEVVDGLKARDFAAPVVIRFSDIIAHRLKQLHDAFDRAIAEHDYGNRYVAAFPIKVNQQRLVVDAVWHGGSDFGFGLEVGSKPELLVALATMEGAGTRPIVCNGFKDASYIEMVILAAKLGRLIIPVIENYAELGLILKYAEKYGVRPHIGVRVKLGTEGVGHWGGSSGQKSKFGLFVSEILEVVRELRERGMLDCLKLVHCHAGSQLADIRRVKDVVNELAQVYGELKALGAGLEYLNIGGGLGVDYDGSGLVSGSSMNYTLAEYARDVVYRVASVCNARGIPHPVIISESGRAIAAHHSVLVFNALGSSRIDRGTNVDLLAGRDEAGLPQPVRDLAETLRELGGGRYTESWHDAQQAREQALQLFNLGYLDLESRGLAEKLYWAIGARIRDLCGGMDLLPEDLAGVEAMLSDIYFCNLSVFQSLPDSWAIGQLFPVMPVHRLDEPPTRQAVIADLTCDSDGKIDRFVANRVVAPTLPLHELVAGQEYYLAAFLVGAYQETLGDLHNLFGDTHVVHVRWSEKGGWWLEEALKGDTAQSVLGYMQYDADDVYPRFARDCERAVSDGRLTVAESQQLKRYYEAELNGYTYFET